jgi:hypothetical protein
VRLTPAGEQIEQALTQGYDVAAFSLYADAIGQDVALAVTEDESDAEAYAVAVWHRTTQERIGWDDAQVQDGSILRQDVLPRDEQGVWQGDPPETTYSENPDAD